MADSNIDHWQHTLGGATAEQLTDFADASQSNGILKAPLANSATLYIGKSTVSSSNGLPLEPGESINVSQFLAPEKLYIRGTLGDKIAYLGSTI